VLVPPPSNAGGARLTVAQSLSILHRRCQWCGEVDEVIFHVKGFSYGLEEAMEHWLGCIKPNLLDMEWAGQF
jgi:hypothetical protein